MRAIAPQAVTVRMYQVGFGDCFLVTFHYPAPLDDERRERHVLLDFGSTHLADGVELVEIAKMIESDCGGRLDVVAISHRHRDHLSAFGSAEVAEILNPLCPRLLLRPWTDAPDAVDGPAADENDRYIQSLRAAQTFAADVGERLRNAGNAMSLAGLRRTAEMAAPNADALAFLEKWADDPKCDARYVSFGMDLRFQEYVPGVTCDVLGPPHVDEWPDVRRQRYDDPEEFWLNAAVAADTIAVPASASAVDNPVLSPDGLGPARWLLDRLAGHAEERLLDLVDGVDNALNNTSLILLFGVKGRGRRRMLFSGDAQIENWEYVLKRAGNTKMLTALADLDLYKVGHHGSRNATPRTLVDMWPPETCARMVALMSTKAGVHGRDGPNPVPKPALVAAFAERRITLLRTDELESNSRCVAVHAAVDEVRAPFEQVQLDDAPATPRGQT